MSKFMNIGYIILYEIADNEQGKSKCYDFCIMKIILDMFSIGNIYLWTK